MIHSFNPQLYYHTMGNYPPVLTVRDGDTVITSTVDARGWDQNGESAAARGNPMTGPFYVEGAMPGDTLAIRFESITPNREWAWTTNMLAPAVIDPAVAAALPASEIVHWTVDVAQGVAYLKEPTPGLAQLKLPLRPFLGCFGVAPSKGQFISTATSGEYGGNMDYKGLVAGTTVYFPVSAEGALFYLGDGHALQGDGEIIGTGLEISMDVRFTVCVQKGKTISWPRGETDTFWFCIGNARPLDQALQHATTEMLRLLQEDCGLTSSEASLLMGQAVEYEIANMFNPAYSVVCKLPKAVLASLV
ncbi:acetamidase/formamidase family protein [Paenibacillus chondroitinus]|uniref:Acetamidase/formamidase family protein n=1 Tax=Paenibacillus chondroitinus TaxID=59842 RepID=A0ABU6DPP4_9BACL|nr:MULTISPECIES: acetamidase/formamidase family protein [Paenibacillus]MCY9663355.1 acetamidase/formamidase family protein [Paenibacillus anseongense]MEB4799295.1 acetamidase/formamidase family protein [Paenibacillus chondroitinus]